MTSWRDVSPGRGVTHALVVPGGTTSGKPLWPAPTRALIPVGVHRITARQGRYQRKRSGQSVAHRGREGRRKHGQQDLPDLVQALWVVVTRPPGVGCRAAVRAQVWRSPAVAHVTGDWGLALPIVYKGRRHIHRRSVYGGAAAAVFAGQGPEPAAWPVAGLHYEVGVGRASQSGASSSRSVRSRPSRRGGGANRPSSRSAPNATRGRSSIASTAR